jgi:D-3-phosphoglycerate dehydrogenase
MAAPNQLRVLVSDPIHPAGIALLGEHGVQVDRTTHDDAAGCATSLLHADAVIVRGLKVTPALMDGAPRLKAVVKHGSGVDNINIPAASERGIVVANTAGGANASAVAEGAVTLMLAVMRRVPETHEATLNGRFRERWHFDLGDLTGKTLGLVGFGKIGRATARICSAGFSMPVKAYDPLVPAEAMREAGVEKVDDLLALMAGVDVVSIHAPYMPSTHHLIGARELAAMRPEAILVHTSRGGIVDEQALAAVLEAGSIRGAGIDVYEKEPPAPDNPLFRVPRIVLSPHMAGSTESSHHHSATEAARAVLEILAGRKPSGLLNGAIWDTRRS